MAKTYFKQDLHSHFEKIEEGKPVHFKRFLLGLAESGVSPNEIDHIFHKVNVGKKRYKVTISPSALSDYRVLKGKVLGEEYTPSPRVVAAQRGRSHSKSASGAFGLLHTQEYQVSPFCFILDEGVPRELPKLKKRLLLIENMELFLLYQRVLSFVNSNGLASEAVDLEHCDVMYSQGSLILNKQFRPFLMNYEKIDCLFDLDFGGVIVYSTLKKYFKNTRFLCPENIDEFMDKYGFPMGEEEVMKLAKLQQENRFPKDVKRLINILTTRHQKLEQEVYLLMI